MSDSSYLKRMIENGEYEWYSPPKAAVLASDETIDEGVCVTVTVAGVGG